MTVKIPVDRIRACRTAGALVGLAVALGACTHTEEAVTVAGYSNDYRQRHPIAIQEADRSIVVFVGQARGGLSASQRADVIGLAQIWLREGTGAISVDVPVDTRNARAAAETFREIQALLAAAGVPAELSEDLRGGRSLRPVAGRSRTLDQEQDLLPEQAILQFRLRLSAQYGGDGRQPVGSRAAAV